MSNKKFLAFLTAVSLFALAVFSGGCGGSSDSKSMRVNVIGTSNSVMRKQITALDEIPDNNISGMEEGDLLILCGIDDIKKNSADIVEAFNRGVAIALEHVDSDDIDLLTDLLGFDNDFLADDQDAEFYGLAIREIDDCLYPFTYIFHGFEDNTSSSDLVPYSYTITSGDASATYTAIYSGDKVVSFDITYSGMSPSDLPDKWWEMARTETPNDSATEITDDLEYKTDDDYYDAVVKDLLDWVKELDELAEDARKSREAITSGTSSFSEEAALSATANGQMLPVAPKTLTLKYSINENLPANRNIWEANKKAIFEARQSLRIYAYHDYTNNKDIFLVESNVTGNPSEGYLDKYYISYGDIVANYTNSARYECELKVKGGTTTLTQNKPDTINSSKEITENYGWNINASVTGTYGVEGEVKGEEQKVTTKKSVSLTVSGGYNYSKTSKYNLSDAKLFKDTRGDKPAWTFKINDEAQPEYSRGFHSGSIKKKPVDLAKNAHSFESAWEWHVNSWPFPNESATVEGNLVWKRGALNANGSGLFWIGASYREETTHTAKSSVVLSRPKYISTNVSSLVFDSSATDKKGLTKSMNLLSSAPWTVTSESDWCKVSPADGKATETSPITLTVNVDVNNSGKPRSTTLTFTNNTTKDKTYVIVTQSQYKSK